MIQPRGGWLDQPFAGVLAAMWPGARAVRSDGEFMREFSSILSGRRVREAGSCHGRIG